MLSLLRRLKNNEPGIKFKQKRIVINILKSKTSISDGCIVIPAKAGIPRLRSPSLCIPNRLRSKQIPAFAGMTGTHTNKKSPAENSTGLK
jgi:hypothetical protein